MAEAIERVQVSPRGRDDELKALARVLASQKESGEMSSFSFLLAGNRDMGFNDFARGIREMVECPDSKVRDITSEVLSGKEF